MFDKSRKWINGKKKRKEKSDETDDIFHSYLQKWKCYARLRKILRRIKVEKDKTCQTQRERERERDDDEIKLPRYYTR